MTIPRSLDEAEPNEALGIRHVYGLNCSQSMKLGEICSADGGQTAN